MESQHIYIKSFNKKGWGIGRLEKGTVAVIGALPLEEVEAELGRFRKGKCQGRLKQVLVAAPHRVQPHCVHVPTCGGCSFQQMDYESQIQYKQEQLEALFDPSVIRPIVRCDTPWQYRNKMEFSFSQNKAGERFLGLVIAGSKGHVMDLKECHLVSPWFIDVLTAVKKWWEASGLHAYRRDDSGTLRTLTVREGKRTGDKLVLLTVSGNPNYAIPKAQIKKFVEVLSEVIGVERVSVFLRVQVARKGMATQFFEMHLSGPDHLMEKCVVEGREFAFKISPSSFFQPNTFQAEKLYAEALKMIPERKKHIMDLYAGIGTLGLICSSKAERVTSIELNPYAVYDAQSNAELNAAHHCEMLKGDVGQVLESLKAKKDFTPPDLIIVDPPRAGLDAKALSNSVGLGAKEILYISCNPTTQAANIQALAVAGYRLETLQPVDQFPHTVHIETIAFLRRM